MKKPFANPSELARETLIKLASHKTPPTPDNYARIYAEISGSPIAGTEGAEKVLRQLADHLGQNPKAAIQAAILKKEIETANWEHCFKEIQQILSKADDGESAKPWASLIRDLLRQLETTHKGITLTRKKEGLETVLKRFAVNPETLFDKLNGLMRSWAESPVATATPEIDTKPVEAATTPPPVSAPSVVAPPSVAAGNAVGQLSEALAQALESLFSALPELATEATPLIRLVRDIRAPEQISELNKQLRHFWIKVELHAGDKAKIHDGLIRLLRLLVENIGEMVEDEEWLHGQVTILQEIIANPIDRRSIADAERGLRDAIIKQGLLKQSLTEAKSTLRSLMTTFIDRLGEITESTGDYHQKIEGYSKKISKSKNLVDLSHLLEDIMQDTRTIQTSALRSHEELVHTRKQVQESETKIRQLEQELSQVSELVREDQLTGALNRRGLDAAFEHDSGQADRTQSPLCVALLDIDNFKRLNDTQGHHAGDLALVHLSTVIKDALRPSDSVARYGGEEFVILLPDTPLEEATATIERLQRELTKQFFLHENERILITFSAGVAQRTPQEPQEEVVGRADKAMYQAKHSGKNRVIAAKN
ncbi:MAG: diguanylate cyclase [Gallionellales bacterium GWA2_59_43]|nr:MAG: diguanylate cyclase [Gallionellales bacterium GWA2_59_43]